VSSLYQKHENSSLAFLVLPAKQASENQPPAMTASFSNIVAGGLFSYYTTTKPSGREEELNESNQSTHPIILIHIIGRGKK